MDATEPYIIANQLLVDADAFGESDLIGSDENDYSVNYVLCVDEAHTNLMALKTCHVRYLTREDVWSRLASKIHIGLYPQTKINTIARDIHKLLGISASSTEQHYAQGKTDRCSAMDLVHDICELLRRNIKNISPKYRKQFENAANDAIRFALKKQVWPCRPLLSYAADGEIGFSWRNDGNELIVDILGDDTYEYAMKRDGIFVPGFEEGKIQDYKLPKDMNEYLNSLA